MTDTSGGILPDPSNPNTISLGIAGAVLAFVFRTLWKQESGWEKQLAASREDADAARKDAAAARADAAEARKDANAAREDARVAREQEAACRAMYAELAARVRLLEAQRGTTS